MSRERSERIRPRSWPVTIAASATLTLASAAIVGMVAISVVAGVEITDDVAMMVAFGAFGAVGAFIVLRRPGQPIGWMFCLMSVLAPLGELGIRVADYLLRSGRTLPAIVVAWTWFGQWYWIPSFGIGLILVPLLYPTGRPPSGRWWSVAWLSAASLIAVGVVFATQPEFVLDWLGPEIVVENPLGISGVPDPDDGPMALLFITVLLWPILAVASLAVRFRRSDARERLQIKWLVYAFSLLVVWLLLDALVLRTSSALPMGVLFAGIPLCTGIAINRYRLYEIDRIVNRTITYAAVVGLLAGVFTGGVALSSMVLPTASNNLGVAASTLAVAGLFDPLRRRVQAMVDDHFHRTPYDPQRVTDHLSTALREMVGPEAVGHLWGAAAVGALQPATAEIWVRDAN